jgi:NTP pyrophosphatase (non-canonical NTP hydrolase)
MNKLAQEIHANARAKGFWDQPRPIAQILMLVVCELAEAVEADRAAATAAPYVVTDEDKDFAARLTGKDYSAWYSTVVKGCFEEEIADAVIRLLDLSAGLGIDLDWHIKAKMKYNATRQFMHGKAY